MIILDTNVLSEPLRPSPDLLVTRWLDAQSVETLYLTTITLAELRYGVAALPAGRRQQLLKDRLDGEVLPLFAGRILPFDEAAAAEFGELQAAARERGRALPLADAMIAAIARTKGFTLATRNVEDFAHAGIPLVNPWEGSTRGS